MEDFKIPASITLAQAILESGDGNSELAKMSNNHFGIKCHDWKGDRVYYDDDEKGECFRKYKNASESFDDHSEFLMRNRYASLFELDIKDYKSWAKGLKKCGYATNPAYAKLLIGLIEKNELYKYDEEYDPSKKEFLAKTEVKEDKKKKSKSKSKNPKIIPNSIVLSSSRSVEVSDNRIKYTIAKDGDTPEKIADEMDLPVWTIRKYNDLTKNQKLVEGELIYIQPKRSKSKSSSHVLKSGETMRAISQQYGIRLKSLYKKNGLEFGTEPTAGTELILR